MSHLFTGSQHAKLYKQFRPQYPDDLTEKIIQYCEKHGNEFEIAIDIGCGSGQNTLTIAPYFTKVIGIDVSEVQIKEAQADKSKPDNVQYKVNSAEDLAFLKDSSVDLITIGTAFHWMDAEQVYKEAKRVLKPVGVMAIFAAGPIALEQEPSSGLIEKFHQTLESNDCWHENPKHVLSKYEHLPAMPFTDVCKYDDIFISKKVKVEDVMGFLMSLSAYQTYTKRYPQSTLAADTSSK